MKTLIAIITVFILSLSPMIFVSCSNDDVEKYQNNDKINDGFELGSGVEEDPYELFVEDDELLGSTFGDVLEHKYSQYIYDFLPELADEFSLNRPYILNTFLRASDLFYNSDIGEMRDTLPGMIGGLTAIVNRVIDQNENDLEPVVSYDDYPASGDFKAGLFEMIDDSDSNFNKSDDVMEILRNVFYFLNDMYGLGWDTYEIGLSVSSEYNIEEIFYEFRELLLDNSETNAGTVIDLLSESMSKLLLRANDNMWLDGSGELITDRTNYGTGTNTNLGNAARGIDALASGLNDMDFEDSEEIEVDTSGDTKTSQLFKDLINNIEDHYTSGGIIYENNTDYNTNNANEYVNAELRNSLNELFPVLNKLMIRGTNEESIINGDAYPLELFVKALNTMNLNVDNLDIDEALRRMTKYDENFKDRTTDPTASNFTAIDKLVWLLTLLDNVGFKVAKEGDGTLCGDRLGAIPNDNGRGHGDPVPYLTLSDALFNARTASPQEIGTRLADKLDSALIAVIGGLLHIILYNGGTELNVYGLYFDDPYGDSVWRNRNTFTANDVNTASDPSKYYFYPQTNSPVLLLAGGENAGDLGLPASDDPLYDGSLPAGGESYDPSIIEPWDGAPADNNVFIPRTKDGLGIIGTFTWTIGWLARTCWKGYGPYYSTENEEDIGGGVYRYYNSNGEVYAEVDKSSGDPSTWIYSNINFKSQWETDPTLLKLDDTGYHDGGVSHTRYYSIDSDLYHNASIQNKTKMGCDPGSPDGMLGYEDTDVQASGIEAIELIGGPGYDNSLRECGSNEETIFKNLQWLLYEKKFILTLPIIIKIETTLLGLVPLSAKSAIALIVEGNGLLGILNCHEVESSSGVDGNGKWAKDGGYGVSTIGGDYRATFMVGGNELWINTSWPVSWVLPDMYGYNYVDIDLLYNTIVKNGTFLPAIVGGNSGVFNILTFLNETAFNAQPIPSSDCGTASPYWEDRNSITPLLIALLGSLYENAKTVPLIPGQEYPRSVPALDIIIKGLLPIISKPMFYYQKNDGIEANSPFECWKPRMPEGYDGNDYIKSQMDEADPDYFKPKYTRNLLSMLTENNAKDFNGFLSLSGGAINELIKYLKDFGGSQYDDPSSALDNDYKTWGARRKLFYGLEQVMTSIKPNKGEMLTNGSMDLNFPEWMFAGGSGGARDEDILLQDILDEVIGSDASDRGLAVFPDHRDPAHPNYIEGYSWDNFDEIFIVLEELLSEDGEKTAGAYNIYDKIKDIIDSGSSTDLTDEKLQSLRHTIGSLFAEYNSVETSWNYPDNLKDIVTNRLPAILGHFSQYQLDQEIAGIDADMDDILDKQLPIAPGSVAIKVNGSRVGFDTDNGDGSGTISGHGITVPGAIDYITGVISFTLDTDPGADSVTADYLPEMYQSPDSCFIDGYYGLTKLLIGDLLYDGSLGSDEADWEENYKWDEGLLKEYGLVEYIIKSGIDDIGSDDAETMFQELSNTSDYMDDATPFWKQINDLLNEVLNLWGWDSYPYGT